MPATPKKSLERTGVIIAIDPHKASWTAVVVTPELSAAASIRVEVSQAGYRQLRRFAASWPQARWAIEGAAGLGAPLTGRLRAALRGVRPRDTLGRTLRALAVELVAELRRLDRRIGDATQALSIAVEASARR